MEVTTDRRSIQQCLEQRYALPTYQRDYKWETKHLRELLEDIQDIFFREFESEHGRTKVSGYEKYFLGTIITIPAEEGRRAIVDGQQRITTLALVVAYFYRISKEKPELQISDIGSLLRKKIFGATQYNIQFSPSRSELFDLLCNHEISDQALDDAVDAIPNFDDGARRMYTAYTHISAYISDDLKDSVIPYFVDYLTQCVTLFEIGVPSEQTGHKVFVTMNDRGLKLGPLDLLKGYLLSNVTDDSQNSSAHEAWKSMLDRLQTLGKDEDSSFFKNWLRAQHAESMRGKQKDAPLADFELAADTYHRWVEDNSGRIGLNNSDDYYTLIKNTLPFFEKNYIKCLKGEHDFSQDFAALYYNGNRDLSLQSMLLLAVLDPADSPAITDTKIKLTAHYLDCYATFRFVNKQDNTYNNLRDPLFDLVKQVRRKSVSELVTILERNFESFAKSEISLSSLNYASDSSMVLHILGRIAHFLEDELELTNRVGFAAYVQRKKSNSTFDIEHLLPNNVDVTKRDLGGLYDFDSDQEYQTLRNSFSGLILLSRGRNRSLKAKSYTEKRHAYATEGVLAQTFCDSFYTNNPQVSGHIARTGVQLQPESVVNKEVLKRREELYNSIARAIWAKSHFYRIASSLVLST